MRLTALFFAGMGLVALTGAAVAPALAQAEPPQQASQKQKGKKPKAQPPQAEQIRGNGLLKALNLSTDVSEAKDFVKETRKPDSTNYISTQIQDTPRPTRVKTADEIRATEASLDAARARHDRIMRRAPKDPGASAAGPEKKKKKKKEAAPSVPIAHPMVSTGRREAN